MCLFESNEKMFSHDTMLDSSQRTSLFEIYDFDEETTIFSKDKTTANSSEILVKEYKIE